jgi:hypothetical protein
MVTPGSVGDWTQALTMVAALVGLAAACGRALREEDRHALSRQPGPSRPPSGLVEDTAAAEGLGGRPVDIVGAASTASLGSILRPLIMG